MSGVHQWRPPIHQPLLWPPGGAVIYTLRGVCGRENKRFPKRLNCLPESAGFLLSYFAKMAYCADLLRLTLTCLDSGRPGPLN